MPTREPGAEVLFQAADMADQVRWVEAINIERQQKKAAGACGAASDMRSGGITYRCVCTLSLLPPSHLGGRRGAEEDCQAGWRPRVVDRPGAGGRSAPRYVRTGTA